MRGIPRPVPPMVRALGLLALLALLLGSLSFVVWRQTRGVALQREIRALEAERAIAESERLRTATRIQGLQSRARILRVARDRLGMHLPADSEVVLVPLNADTAPGGAAAESR
jgi:cell division protein FtsL